MGQVEIWVLFCITNPEMSRLNILYEPFGLIEMNRVLSPKLYCDSSGYIHRLNTYLQTLV